MSYLLPNQSSQLRHRLDQLLAFDSCASVVFGILALLSPHHVIQHLGGGTYNHAAHETLRLYGCLRLACGWILWHIRHVDDGIFRRHVCEALGICYMLQVLAVIRAQWTDTQFTMVNILALCVLSTLAVAYGSFRWGRGGNLIKIYELPTTGSMM